MSQSSESWEETSIAQSTKFDFPSTVRLNPGGRLPSDQLEIAMAAAGDDDKPSQLAKALSEKRLAQASNFKPRPGDVFVVSYPKSGTTWMTKILCHLLADDQEATKTQFDKVPLMEAVPWLEMSPVEAVESPEQAGRARRIFKSHLPFKYMPFLSERETDKSVKYIYVARNPKDVAVSYFHHRQLFKVNNFNGDWPEFFELFISGNVPYRSWFEHVESWWEHHHDDDILFLKYENLKKNTKASVEQIASFLGISELTHAIDAAVEQSTFDKMQVLDANKKLLPDPEKYPFFATNEDKQFLRKGIVGDWKNYFTAEQSARLDAQFAQLLAKCPGLEFTFE